MPKWNIFSMMLKCVCSLGFSVCSVCDSQNNAFRFSSHAMVGQGEPDWNFKKLNRDNEWQSFGPGENSPSFQCVLGATQLENSSGKGPGAAGRHRGKQEAATRTVQEVKVASGKALPAGRGRGSSDQL